MRTKSRKPEVSSIHKAISEKIMSGEYSAGYRLVEAELAATFKVSRTPVRIAIERLVLEGLAMHTPNKGAVVRRMTIDEIRGLFEIRAVNEALAARLGSQNIRKKDPVILKEILEKMKDAIAAEDLQMYYTLSGRIHGHIREMANNEFLVDIINRVYTLTRSYHVNILRLPGRISTSYEEHKQVVDAVLSGDAKLAEQTMLNHIAKVADFYYDPKNRLFLYSLSQLNW